MPTSSRRIASALVVLLVATTLLACDSFTQQGNVSIGVLIVDPGPNPSDQDIDAARSAVLRYAELGRSRPIAVAVVERLGLDEAPASLLERVSTAGSPEGLTLQLEVRDDDPDLARDLVLALGDTMIAHVEAELSPQRVPGELQDDPATVHEALQRDINERFADIVEPRDPLMLARHRLRWLEEPRRAAAD